MNDLITDFRYALRRLGREKAFTIAAVSCLALGIGATTAIFTVVNGVLLRQLPLDAPERVVHVWQTWTPKAWHDEQISAPELKDYQARARTVEHVAGYITGGTALADGDHAQRVQMALVTPEFFDVAGVRPMLGRTFTAEEATVPFAVFAVLSHSLWTSAFARDADVVGRQVTMGGRMVTVLGVMPEGFEFPQGVSLWRPLVLSPADLADRNQHFINALARLRPGVSVAAASAELNTLALHMPSNVPGGARAVPALDQLVGPVRPALWLLLAAVSVVLLIACGNVANLMLARAAARRREIAVRAAIGASGVRIIRQLLTESVTLAAAGAVLGLLLAVAAVRVLTVIGPPNIPRLADIRIDLRVLAFTLVSSIGTGVLFGLAPALSASRVNFNDALKETRASPGSGQRRLRRALVVAEIALSLVLLVGGSLLVQSFLHLRAVDPGFRTASVLTARVSLPGATYPRPPQRIAFYDDVLRRARAIPGVVAAGASSILPISPENVSSSAIKEGTTQRGRWPEANVRSVTTGYLETLGVPLVMGRAFAENDGADSTAPKTALINLAMAARIWPGENPIGKRFSIFAPPDRPNFREVIGVVGDIHQSRLDAPPQIEAYEPFHRTGDGAMSIVVRTTGDPRALISQVRAIVAALDKTIPLYDIRTMDEQITRSLSARRFNTVLLGAFSLIAIVLAGIGLYGVVTYTVGQRTGEIGLRVALGAQPRDVQALVVGEGLALALAGVALGSIGAVLGTRLLRGMLYDVRAGDPITFIGCAAGLIVMALLASYLPSRRAARIDPLIALRTDG